MEHPPSSEPREPCGPRPAPFHPGNTMEYNAQTLIALEEERSREIKELEEKISEQDRTMEQLQMNYDEIQRQIHSRKLDIAEEKKNQECVMEEINRQTRFLALIEGQATEVELTTGPKFDEVLVLYRSLRDPYDTAINQLNESTAQGEEVAASPLLNDAMAKIAVARAVMSSELSAALESHERCVSKVKSKLTVVANMPNVWTSDSWKQRVKDLENATEAKHLLKELNDVLMEKNKALKSDKASKIRRQKQNEAKMKDIVADITKITEATAACEAEIKTIAEQLTEAKAERLALAQEADRIEEANRCLAAEYDTIHSELLKTKEEAAVQTKLIEEFSKQMSVFETESAKELQQLLQKLKDVRDENAKIVMENNIMAGRKFEVSRQLQMQRANLDEAKKELQSKMETREKLRIDKQCREEKSKEQKDEVDTLKNELQQVQMELNAERLREAERHSENYRLANEISRLEKEIAEARDEAKKMEESIRQKSLALTRIEEGAELSKLAFESYSQAICDTREELKTLDEMEEANRKEYEYQVQSVQTILRGVDEENKQLEKKIAELEEEFKENVDQCSQPVRFKKDSEKKQIVLGEQNMKPPSKAPAVKTEPADSSVFDYKDGNDSDIEFICEKKRKVAFRGGK